MLALLLATALGARAAQLESKAPIAPQAAFGLPSAPRTLALPTLPALTEMRRAPAMPAPAAVVKASPAAAVQAAPAAVSGLRALGRGLARAARGATPQGASARLSAFFDRVDGGGESAEPPDAPREHDWFPRKLGLPKPVRREVPPPPPPRFKNRLLKRLAMAAPGFFVAANTLVGIEAMMGAHTGWVLDAGAMVLFAGVFSDLAARAAKLFRVPADVEGRIDAIAGTVSFAAAPAYILYKTALQTLPWAGLAAAVFFAAAGIYRVARERPDDRGLTVQAASATMVALALASGVLPPLAVPFMTAATALLAAAMLSRARFPRYRKVTVPLILILGALYAGFQAPLAHPRLWALAPLIGFGGYFASALLRRLLKAHE